MTSQSEPFYSQLPVRELELSQLIKQKELFDKVPDDWEVVLTDIKQSTQAVETGSQEIVNLIATGSIIAALNIGYANQTLLPFFFGGDGATLLVPPSLLEPIMEALRVHRENTFRNYELELRVGSVPVNEIFQAGHDIQIAKAKLNSVFSIPVVLGEGLAYAEKLIKGKESEPHMDARELRLLNLEGMECRWDHIKPPQPTQEVVCLLVQALKEEDQAHIYSEVLSTIDELYGPQHTRKPISIPRLKLKPSLSKLKTEMTVRLGQFNLGYLLKNWLITLFGPFYVRYVPTGKNYLKLLIELSDTLVIDGRINTVISGTPEQRKTLEEKLTQLEAQGKMVYGLNVSAESVMSCYVRGRDEEHIHFIDGSGGGYTQAARMLKRKMKGNNNG